MISQRAKGTVPPEFEGLNMVELSQVLGVACHAVGFDATLPGGRDVRLRGLESLTIMAEAGLTRGGFYAHFNSKKDLFYWMGEVGVRVEPRPIGFAGLKRETRHSNAGRHCFSNKAAHQLFNPNAVQQAMPRFLNGDHTSHQLALILPPYQCGTTLIL